jgi:hypothetical protein
MSPVNPDSCGSWLACEWSDTVCLNGRINFFAGKPAPTGFYDCHISAINLTYSPGTFLSI